MTTAEAKEILKKDFMNRYDQWMKDRIELNDHDYGWKYGWQKSEKLMKLKDNLTAVAMFQKYIDLMRSANKLEKELGIERKATWGLAKEGWLSEAQRQWEMYYFISQRVAKEIWEETRAKTPSDEN